MPFKRAEDRRAYQRQFYKSEAQRQRRAANQRVVRRRARYRIFERDGYQCAYCERCWDPRFLEVDHKLPLSKGGRHADANKITACRTCNRRKGNRSYGVFLGLMRPDRVPDWVTEERPEGDDDAIPDG